MKNEVQVAAYLAIAMAASIPSPSISQTATPYVTIGQLDWMSRNVDAATFQNGDPIEIVDDAAAWAEAGRTGRPAMAYYGGSGRSRSEWGRLYNYAAVIDPRGLCPSGWRVPSDGDWAQLESEIGSASAAASLRSRDSWPEGSTGLSDTGFDAFPAGFRTQRGDYFLAGRVAYFWSETEVGTEGITAHMLFDYDSKIFRIVYSKAMGMSLRCVRRRTS